MPKKTVMQLGEPTPPPAPILATRPWRSMIIAQIVVLFVGLMVFGIIMLGVSSSQRSVHSAAMAAYRDGIATYQADQAQAKDHNDAAAILNRLLGGATPAERQLVGAVDGADLAPVVVPVEPRPPAAISYQLSPGKLPFGLFWALIALGVAALGWALGICCFYATSLAWVTTPTVARQEIRPPFAYKLDGFANNYKIWSMVLFPLLFVRILWRPWLAPIQHHQARRRANQATADAIAAESLSLLKLRQENPLAFELLATRRNRERLLAMPKSRARDAALKDTVALISELERFPTQLSTLAGELMAKQVLAENLETRDKPQALLEATKEVDEIGEGP